MKVVLALNVYVQRVNYINSTYLLCLVNAAAFLTILLYASRLLWSIRLLCWILYKLLFFELPSTAQNILFLETLYSADPPEIRTKFFKSYWMKIISKWILSISQENSFKSTTIGKRYRNLRNCQKYYSS